MACYLEKWKLRAAHALHGEHGGGDAVGYCSAAHVAPATANLNCNLISTTVNRKLQKKFNV